MLHYLGQYEYKRILLDKKSWLDGNQILNQVVSNTVKFGSNPAYLNMNIPDIGNHKEVLYKNVAEFLKQNPNCCNFVKGNLSDRLLDRWLGHYAGYINLNYLARFKSKSEYVKYNNFRSSFEVTNCGETYIGIR